MCFIHSDLYMLSMGLHPNRSSETFLTYNCKEMFYSSSVPDAHLFGNCALCVSYRTLSIDIKCAGHCIGSWKTYDVTVLVLTGTKLLVLGMLLVSLRYGLFAGAFLITCQKLNIVRMEKILQLFFTQFIILYVLAQIWGASHFIL